MRHTAKISILILALAFSQGCAGMQSDERGHFVSDGPSELLQPGTPFPSVEEAAVAALGYIRSTATRNEAERLYVGPIIRIDGGYTWTQAEHSGNHLRATWRPTARVSLSPDHVATYIIHPRTGDSRTDRANDGISQGERRLVDEVDPLHRPLFLLTPTGRIVEYSHGASVTEVVDRRGRRNEKRGGVSSLSAVTTGDAASSVELAAEIR